MSRRGNCWDNAPMESFLGNMKDEIDLKKCDSLSDMKKYQVTCIIIIIIDIIGI